MRSRRYETRANIGSDAARIFDGEGAVGGRGGKGRRGRKGEDAAPPASRDGACSEVRHRIMVPAGSGAILGASVLVAMASEGLDGASRPQYLIRGALRVASPPQRCPCGRRRGTESRRNWDFGGPAPEVSKGLEASAPDAHLSWSPRHMPASRGTQGPP